MGYKNAPHLEPRIGDEVYCGLPGNTAIVASIEKNDRDPMIRNCSTDGKLRLNYEQEAVIKQDVDGNLYD